MKKLLTIASVVCLLAFSAFGQSTSNVLTATSLASAVTTTSQTVFRVASATNIVAASTLLYLEDGYGGNPEAVFVNSVNGTTISVTRGYNGTLANTHLAGTVVLVGAPYQFYSVDPSGSCTSSTATTPYVNIMRGTQWICSSVTGQWVPGFFNDLKNPGVSAAVASVAGATEPSGPLFHVTGTNAITAWGTSTTAGLGAGGGSTTSPAGAAFCVIPDAVFTTTATNNIALASTAVVNKPLCYTFDSTNHKYVPSY